MYHVNPVLTINPTINPIFFYFKINF